jgi:hypothetical protein
MSTFRVIITSLCGAMATQVPMQCVSGPSFPAAKIPGHEVDSHPSNTEAKTVWSYASTPIVFMTWCLIKNKGNYISFYLKDCHKNKKLCYFSTVYVNKMRREQLIFFAGSLQCKSCKTKTYLV